MPYIDFVSKEDRVSLWYTTNTHQGGTSDFDPDKPVVVMYVCCRSMFSLSPYPNAFHLQYLDYILSSWILLGSHTKWRTLDSVPVSIYLHLTCVVLEGATPDPAVLMMLGWTLRILLSLLR